jgi:methyl-accepting chemotaxis protein
MMTRFTRLSVVHQLALLTLVITAILLGGLTVFLTHQSSKTALRGVESALAHEVSLMGDSLELFHGSLVASTNRLGEIFFGMFPGGLRIEEALTVEVGGQSIPALMSQSERVNLNFSKPDEFSRLTGGTATVFQRVGDDFLRVSTSLRKEDGSRAVGTFLGKGHPGYQTLIGGETYMGPARLFGRDYMTKYIPFKDPAGKVAGILYVGFDYTEQLADLERRFSAYTFGDNGYAYVISNRRDGSRGVLLLHPSLTGESLLDKTDGDGNRIFEQMLDAGTGVMQYPWPDAQRGGELRDKLVAHQAVEGWDWVIAAGSFTDEFLISAIRLRNELIVFTVLTGVLLAGLVLLALRWQLKPLHAIGEAMERLGDGDLSVEVKHTADRESTRNEMQFLGHRVNYMVRRLREMVSEVLDSATSLSSSADEMAAVSEQTSQGVRQQQGDTDLVATAINQMAATVQEVANSAATAAEQTRTADEQSSRGGAVVREVIAAIGDLAAEVEQSAGVIAQVEQQSDGIGSVIEVITSIAEQTNLLALNAAIEAARAGDQGRGFAVVADEVRVLAQKTRQSTTEIETMIEGLQESAKSAVKTMETGREKAQATVEQAAKAGETLDQITDSIATITSMTTQIAAAAEEQTVVAEDINQRVVSIRDVADHNAGGSDEIARAMHELQRVATQLKDTVGQFRL